MTSKEDHKKRVALASGGAVAGTVGLATGGIPGAKSDFTTVLNPSINRSHGGGAHKGPKGPGTRKPGSHRADSRLVARARLPKALPGGALGFRVHAHEGGTAGFMEAAAAHAAHPAQDAVNAFYQGHNAGKIPAELKVLRGMNRGRAAANVAMVGGAGTTAYALGLHHKKKPVSKNHKRTDEYNAALVGTGGTAAAATHYGAKYLDKHKRRYEASAGRNIDEAGKLVPAIAGRKQKKISDRQAYKLIREKKPHPLTMYPKVSDGDVGRNPDLMKGVPHEVARKAGELRGAAKQEQHFAEVFGNTAKGVRRFRAPAAVLGAAGVGGLVVTHDKIHKAAKPLMSDAELRRRKKVQSVTWKTTGSLGLAGAGMGATALALKKNPALLKKVPVARKLTHDGLREAGIYTGLAAGGIGGAASFNSAAISGAEARKRTMLQPKKKIQKNASAFGVVHD